MLEDLSSYKGNFFSLDDRFFIFLFYLDILDLKILIDFQPSPQPPTLTSTPALNTAPTPNSQPTPTSTP